jgi:hypothetical protein
LLREPIKSFSVKLPFLRRTNTGNADRIPFAVFQNSVPRTDRNGSLLKVYSQQFISSMFMKCIFIITYCFENIQRFEGELFTVEPANKNK